MTNLLLLLILIAIVAPAVILKMGKVAFVVAQVLFCCAITLGVIAGLWHWITPLWDKLVEYAEVAGVLVLIVVFIGVVSAAISLPLIATLIPIVRFVRRVFNVTPRSV